MSFCLNYYQRTYLDVSFNIDHFEYLQNINLFPFLKERVIQRLNTRGKCLKFVCMSVQANQKRAFHRTSLQVIGDGKSEAEVCFSNPFQIGPVKEKIVSQIFLNGINGEHYIVVKQAQVKESDNESDRIPGCGPTFASLVLEFDGILECP